MRQSFVLGCFIVCCSVVCENLVSSVNTDDDLLDIWTITKRNEHQADEQLRSDYALLLRELVKEYKELDEMSSQNSGKQNYLPPIINEFDFTGSTLSIGAITITSDRYVVLMRRASWTGEGAGKIDRPGGHPEPDETLKVH